MRSLAPRSDAPAFARWAALWMAALVAGSAAAGDGPPLGNAGPKVVPAEVEADGVTVRVHPNQVRIDRSRRFDAEGNTQQLNNQLQINFQATVTSERSVLAYRSHGVIRLRDGWDRKLVMPNPATQRNDPWTTIQPNRHGNHNPNRPDAQFSFRFETEAPNADVRVLSEIGGRVELRVARGELRAIRLAPLGDYLGRRLRVRDMDDVRLRVERTNERGEAAVQLSLPAEMMPQIREVRFFSAEGRGLPGGDSSWQRRQGNVERRVYRGAPADTATMEIHVYPGVEVIEVPWTVRDVPLPASADAGPVEELALDTQPLGGGPKIPGLDVEVEE